MCWFDLKDPDGWAFVDTADPITKKNEFAFPYGKNVEETQTVTSVLLPLSGPDFHARVLLFGAADAAVIIDTSKLSPPQKNFAAATLVERQLDGAPARLNASLVLLPTGQVLAIGGHSDPQNEKTGEKHPELFTPAGTIIQGPETVEDSWMVLEQLIQQVRGYHSVALLTPDGAVWVAGSDIAAGTGLDHAITSIEIFRPWYFACARPTVLESPTKLTSSALQFSITVAHHRPIVRVVLIRCGSATHAFDADQRCLVLGATNAAAYDPGTFVVSALGLPNSNIAIPGYYLLFVLDEFGIPSTGRFVRIAP